MQLDHVLIAVTDLTSAAEECEARYGLTSIEGGRHPGWGTANRIVPLGDSYLELVAVLDEDEAAGSVFGRWVAKGATETGSLLGWAVRTRDIDGLARRLALTPLPGSRTRGDGSVISWRFAGLDEAAAESCLPFFIEWGPDVELPGQAGSSSVALTKLVVRGDAERLSTWLGGHSLPIEVEPGDPGVVRFVLG